MLDTRSEVRGQVLRRFDNLLGALGGGPARAVMMRTLNHEGDKPRLLRPSRRAAHGSLVALPMRSPVCSRSNRWRQVMGVSVAMLGVAAGALSVSGMPPTPCRDRIPRFSCSTGSQPLIFRQ